jgi:gentisate 1,2-dioxygenase
MVGPEYVNQGAGGSVIDGQRFEWSTGDMFVIPPGRRSTTRRASRDLFAITARPILEAFGLYREVALDDAQEVTSHFDREWSWAAPATGADAAAR